MNVLLKRRYNTRNQYCVSEIQIKTQMQITFLQTIAFTLAQGLDPVVFYVLGKPSSFKRKLLPSRKMQKMAAIKTNGNMTPNIVSCSSSSINYYCSYTAIYTTGCKFKEPLTQLSLYYIANQGSAFTTREASQLRVIGDTP